MPNTEKHIYKYALNIVDDKNKPKMIFKIAYFNSKAKTIIIENEINESIQTSKTLNGIAV